MKYSNTHVIAVLYLKFHMKIYHMTLMIHVKFRLFEVALETNQIKLL